MMNLEAATKLAKEKLETGELADTAAANVYITRLVGVRLISGKLPSDVRKALNAAVKAGQLGRLAKKGLMPEAYFHPDYKGIADTQRQIIAFEAVKTIQKVCC